MNAPFRRGFLRSASCGFGYLAMSGLAATSERSPQDAVLSPPKALPEAMVLRLESDR